jgi:hypothetical protein
MRYLFTFALLLPMVVFAQDPPLPETLLNAKTAFVENRSAKDKDFDKFCKELKKWGRFTFVQDRNSTDILISVYGEKQRGIRDRYVRPMEGYNWEANAINIHDRFGVLLYTDTTTEHFQNPKDLVSHLKKKMKQK